MKFALNSFIVPGETWQEKFINLDELGYEGIEIRLIGDLSHQEAQVNEILNLAQNSEVKPCSLVRPTPAFLKELTQESLEEKIADVTRMVEYAAALGVPAIVSAGVCVQPSLPSPFLPLPPMDNDKRALLKTYLIEVGNLAQQSGAYLLLEPLNRYEGGFYHRIAEVVEILEELGNNHLGILADVFHINIEEASTEDAILSAGDWLLHVQMGDNNRLLPGEGQFDFKAFFTALNTVGYDGYLAMECIAPKGEMKPLRTSLRFLQNIKQELGA